jgi:hypothetical protein
MSRAGTFLARVAGALLVGCALHALSGCAMFVSKDEYRDYRAVRLARGDRERLLALQQYAFFHGDGRWIDEVETERSERELSVFESGKSTRAGLELYLAAYPDGELVQQARSRLAAIDVIEGRKRAEQAAQAQLDEQRKTRDAELQRTWVERFAGYWVRTLSALQGFGQPIDKVAAQNAEFSRAFGRQPRPRCTSDACVKQYESHYALPVPGGTRIERSMRLSLRLQMKEGKLFRAELLLPSFGFSRWREVQERKPVIDADAQDRSAAVQWAVDKLLAALPRNADGSAPKLVPEPGYALAGIDAGKLGPTTELTDTTAEDPSAPTKRVAEVPMPGAGQSTGPKEKTLEEIVGTPAPAAADMELAPMSIDAQGRAVPAQPPAPAAPLTAPAAGEEMVFEPMAVPKGEGGGAGAPAANPAVPAPAPATTAAFAPARVEAYRMGAYRVVVFAAAANDAGSAVDGVIIELP